MVGLEEETRERAGDRGGAFVVGRSEAGGEIREPPLRNAVGV